ncbi:bifunctional aspartate kinase/homoserine dehydrogenase I [Pseudofulvimonas gallinarii]|uniref:Bifunctional aspartokinase/homoserine dehydrogenase n=1 Tax=Pseudofulvimonas gallinarii TaxID=634155 RepID=A0A4S3KW19_9GAMM|nr:bifunctional aspartate kinase/homoserine dehydrogenase I [Pseudofulvimonas gallinarii]TCS97746.1 aspartate kinase [Pseudofulvimonas gallinarii]THD13380.1 bifunctional aspartate kinase/homoserine dehydrogenase I [Pseudofulvimonas gallinarii]
MGWVAHKFGGSSLADAGRIRQVATVLGARDDAAQVVVVSAMAGVTDALTRLVTDAAAGDADWRVQLAGLRGRHVEAATTLLGEHADLGWLDSVFADLADLLHAQSLLGSLSREALDFVQGLGEVLSAGLLTRYLRSQGREAARLDARDVLVVSETELGRVVEDTPTRDRLAAWRAVHDARCVVVTGFVCRAADGRITTLGRNGSDYSGAIFADLFDATALHIWTDVDGVLSADPRLVPEAVLLDRLSYDEACELAYFGARVIHPQTLAPAIRRGMPIVIRNTFNAGHPGTRIEAESSAQPPVKGLTTIGDLAIVNLEGAGMIGVPGTAERVFGALHDAGVSVVMISQGSSEHSICSVVRAAQAGRAVAALQHAFAAELAAGSIHAVTSTPDIAVLAVVGDGMAGTPGIAAQVFNSLARAQVNIRAIAQGASERNISIAVAAGDASRALRAVHAAFFLSPQTVSVGIVGPGNVGRVFLQQLAARGEELRRRANLDLRVRAIANSRVQCLHESGIDPAAWPETLAAATAPLELDAFADHVRAPHLPHALIVDLSASSEIAGHYAGWLARGIHVVTPNKQAGSGDWSRYQAIRAAQAEGRSLFRYEATVGAGLPVISTLRDLLDTGDDILSIEGILSGTLAWLFNRFDGSVPFSALVREARELGYTEPDPRDDLSGMDVARKLTILAREAGWSLRLEDVEVESLVPEALRGVPREDFLARLHELDEALATRLAGARDRGCILRHVAHLDAEGRARVGIAELPADHAFAHLALTDNIIQFRSRRYCDNPLIVRGPGAGPDVTAAGVFADVLRVAAALGAQL